jgi:RNase_H superfamily
MKRRYLAFDIETAKDVPGDDFNWRLHRPLGICCAAALREDVPELIAWRGSTDGNPAPRLSRSEARQVVEDLATFSAKGYTLLTWNGLGFDLDVLSEEAGMRQECRTLALEHVDMMFHVFCDRGFPVALEKAAQAQGIPGKPRGMSGQLAPRLWAEGRYQEVMDYVSQDVRITLQTATECEGWRRFRWITRRGTANSIELPRGWLTVREALQLPRPDTSWMDNPIPRSEFTSWLDLP